MGRDGFLGAPERPAVRQPLGVPGLLPQREPLRRGHAQPLPPHTHASPAPAGGLHGPRPLGNARLRRRRWPGSRRLPGGKDLIEGGGGGVGPEEPRRPLAPSPAGRPHRRVGRGPPQGVLGPGTEGLPGGVG